MILPVYTNITYPKLIEKIKYDNFCFYIKFLETEARTLLQKFTITRYSPCFEYLKLLRLKILLYILTSKIFSNYSHILCLSENVYC